MAKKVKKSALSPEIRRQWFRRFEEAGELPPQIAEADGYDVRTVRKHIELARQEREAREARSLVLRQALELHYKDLVEFAERLERALTMNSPDLLPPMRGNPMSSALREHIPRSPIWKGLDRWAYLRTELTRLKEGATTRLLQRLESGHTYQLASGSHEPGLCLAPIRTLIGNRLMDLAQGASPAPEQPTSSVSQDGLVLINYGGLHCAAVQPEQESNASELISNVMNECTDSPECKNMEQTMSELQTLRTKLGEELTTIRLRRLVPGRCRSCPI